MRSSGVFNKTEQNIMSSQRLVGEIWSDSTFRVASQITLQRAAFGEKARIRPSSPNSHVLDFGLRFQ